MRLNNCKSEVISLKHLKSLAVLFCIAYMPGIVSGQADIHFSQFYETSILRNPRPYRCVFR